MKRLLISLLLFSSILLGGWSKIEALTQGWAPPEDYRSEESLEIVLEPLEEEDTVIDESKEEMSMEDIFGSEQVFPFPPGLGN